MMDTPNAPRRPVVAAIVVTLSALLTGVAIGIAADRAVASRFPSLPRELPAPPGLEESPAKRKEFIAQLARELDLTEAQQAKVEALISQEAPRLRAAFDSARGIMRNAIRTPQEQLMQILTPAQQEKFRKLVPVL